MHKIVQKILKARLIIIIITALLTVFFGYGLTKLTINSDIISYLKPRDPAVILFNRIGEEYAGNLTIFTVIRSENTFTQETLSLINTLTELHRQIEGVASVTSLANIIDIRGTDAGLEIGKLISPEEIPTDAEKLSELRSYVLSKDLYSGKVVSEDGSTSVIVSRLNPRYNRIAVARELRTRTEAVKGPYAVQYSGYPIQMAELSRFLTNDLIKLIPIVIVVIIGTLYASFRTGRGIVLPLSIVLISTVWTLGIMGYAKIPLTIMSNIVPVVLLAVGTAYGIHFIARYYEDVFQEESKLESLNHTLSTVGVPILLAGVTTILGFLSFSGAYLTAITVFGIFTALGVFFAMVLSLTFIPSVLSYMKVRNVVKMNREEPRFGKVMEALGKLIARRIRPVVIVIAGIGFVTLFAFPNIKIATQLTTYFPRKSDIRKAEATINEEFGGSTPLQVVIRGDLKNPAVLKELYLLQKFLASLPNVHNTQSIADMVSRMNEIMNNRKTIPETREELANLLFMLEGEEVLDQLVKKDYSEGVIQAVFGEESGDARNKTIDLIRSYLRARSKESIVVVRKDELTPEDRNVADQAMYEYMANALAYDLKPYRVLHTGGIRSALKAAFSGERPPLTDPDQEALRSELDTYFSEESELWIDSSRDRYRLVSGLIGEFSAKRPVLSAVTAFLKLHVPARYWKDTPDALIAAAEHLAARLADVQGRSIVHAAADTLVEKILPEYRENETVRKIVRDNLWQYTEQTVRVPASQLKERKGTVEELPFSGELGGMIVILNRLDRYLLKSQLQSIALALVTVFLLLWLQFKSVKMGLITLSPILLVILFNFAILGFLNIPLDYATMLVGSILIGVGIDYSIHFTSRYNYERRFNPDQETSIIRALSTTGTAVVINAAMVAFGFFALIGGNLIPIRRAGWIIGVLMLLSASTALIYLPAVLLMLRKLLKDA